VTFRTKLLFISSFTVAGAVALVTGAVSVSTRRAFERVDSERRQALLDQFRSELDAQSKEIARRVGVAAASSNVQEITAGNAEYDRAQTEAEAVSLDFLDVVKPDFSIISSAHWPARFGYQNNWQIAPQDWKATDVFLTRIPLPEGTAVALIAVRPAPGGRAYVAGGRRISPEFLKSLGLAPGMRALLWAPPEEVVDAQGTASDPHKLSALIGEVRATGREATGTVQWNADRNSAEAFLALPILRDGNLSGVLFAGTSLREQLRLERAILSTGLLVAASGVVIGALLGWWTTERMANSRVPSTV
jgi:two-component system nitrogen regulation sensor histidine kinase NtrY